MKTFIKKARVGQIVKSEALGFKGKVVDVMGYPDTLESMHKGNLKEENTRLQNALGENYKDLYFECVIEILEHYPESDFAAKRLPF